MQEKNHLTGQGKSVHVVDEVDETQYSHSHVVYDADIPQAFGSPRLLLLEKRRRRLIVTVYHQLLIRSVRSNTTLVHCVCTAQY